eukprot:TRINITY_DN26910_c0_g1_i1.p1 TRINITY_DN26910_c0_g1~~TRINITY_DN26910_c0_g1_i1.p1  ORF type:complete len:271 (-),score=60.41 TRINITY_DN26910_c0_g1_i1:331-1143(-)
MKHIEMAGSPFDTPCAELPCVVPSMAPLRRRMVVKQMKSHRRVVLLASLATFALWQRCCCLAFLERPAHCGARAQRVLTRRDLGQGLVALLGSLTGSSELSLQPAQAVKYKPVGEKELTKLKTGYTNLENLVADWDKYTRVCSNEIERQALETSAGDGRIKACEANANVVREKFGMKSLTANLYNTEQLWKDIQMADMVPSGKDDRFQDLIEDFEKYKREADEWAYTSTWGEANPGGGKDKVEEYLVKSKEYTVKATQALKEIVQILHLN